MGCSNQLDTEPPSSYIRDVSEQAPLTVNALIDVARMLGFAVTVDPFAELESKELLGSLYGAVYGALDASCALSHPNSEATEAELEEWETATRTGYISALRELPTEDENAWSAFYYKMLSLGTQRIFTLATAGRNQACLTACIALQVAVLLFHCQFQNMMELESAETLTNLEEATGHLVDAVAKFMEKKEKKA